MKKHYLLITTVLLTVQSSFSQFSLDGEFRPRTEYRHGFGNLFPNKAEPGFAISTRARLNAGYKTDSYEVYLSFQDVLVWGENRQILPLDLNNSFSIFQAWSKLKLSSNLSTKLGRQVISYDDQRIFGGLDWAQQGRNHDALLLNYKKEKFMLDLGLAYNQDFSNPSGFISQGNAYNTTGFFSYKTMQYVYLKQQWDSFSGSLLLLNNGFQEFEEDETTADGLSNLQTFGTHMNYGKGKFSVAGNLFFQTGERQGEVDVKGAYLASLDLNIKATDKTTFGIGAELISGNDVAPGKTGAFFPLYGTNHKFNGFMDYFYVGNHANSVGIVDVHASANFAFKNNSALLIKVLNFSGEQKLASGEKSLGTEVDLVYSKTFNGYSLKAGYSQMFANDGMYELKGITEANAADSHNWAWLMLIFKPSFL